MRSPASSTRSNPGGRPRGPFGRRNEVDNENPRNELGGAREGERDRLMNDQLINNGLEGGEIRVRE